MNLKDKEKIFLDLYKKRLKYVVGYCRNHVWMDYYAPEDMAQEIFMQVYTGLDAFRGESKLDTWLYRVMRNYCNNRYRWQMQKKRFGKNMSMDATNKHDWAFGIQDRQINSLDAVIHGDYVDRVMQCIHSLSPQHRNALIAIMTYDDYDTAAKSLKVPVGTFRSRLNRARVRANAKMLKLGLKQS